MLFGAALPGARAYAELLCRVGIDRGLLGPHEAERIWDRHLLNSVAVAGLLPADAGIVDVGSGAGLPGIALALARPDVRVTLLDSALRRIVFLTEAVAELGLADRVTVLRARAEEISRAEDVVVARAVAELPRLAAWTAGLARPGGMLLAIRGAGAEDELAATAAGVRRAGWQDAEIVTLEPDGVSPIRVVRARRG